MEPNSNWYRVATKAMIALEHICPRRFFITTLELKLLEFWECTVNAFREAGGVNRLARTHAPDRQAHEHCLRRNGHGRMGERGEDCDVRRETEPAQTRATRGKNCQTGRGSGV